MSSEVEIHRSRSQARFEAQRNPRAPSHRKQASGKRRTPHARISSEAKQVLEEKFASNPYPCAWEIDIIAYQTSLDAKKVRNWFNNARARRQCPQNSCPAAGLSDENAQSLRTKLSKESLEALSKQIDTATQPPQPPLAVYLASPFQEEPAAIEAIEAAVESGTQRDQLDALDSSSSSRVGSSSSIIKSQPSSESSVPTLYTMSSNSSSFGRDRRRGRRRMNWRTSPYSKMTPTRSKAGGSNLKLPFFCTFCSRAFKNKYDWTRHEDSVHALRTTWICCLAKQDSLHSCPFCSVLQPDEEHLATHKYQQCKNKPESQRTFFRRDHFVQHLHHVHFSNIKHPSEELGCQSRLTSSEGHNYGCKDLAMKWRRFGAPLRPDDPMLQCGFCGKRLKDWNERCEHVVDHIAEGLDRSAWWPERLENHLENLCVPQTTGPFRCRYCQKVFTNTTARDKHVHCRVWSCRFLSTFDNIASESTGPPLCPQFPSPKAHHCHLCGAGYKSSTSHVEHAQSYHKYRLCKQELYASKNEFLQHIHEFHGASQPPLLQYNYLIEENFSRNKGASFEPVDFGELVRHGRTTSPNASFVDPLAEAGRNLVASPKSEDRTVSESPPSRRRTRDRISEFIDTRVRDHSSKSSSTPVNLGPRFFRLDPLVPFLSMRLYYLRSVKSSDPLAEARSLLEEVSHSHIATLVMSSGLVGMAGVRWPVNMKKDETKGLVEFALED
ncbi:hypothetical protein K469DRAFT_545486 [Zopfia rhizophila CBS 207.26]|uniref:Homeobox domain-containing protein n=1 Tax=Zopfia rhizophila CBS 207.26 TaxID=1314779 RepID=A0A6A6EVV1_9PEZI|nr:hypothetical protein K469DRAFT_545486 [Zopfia rhizophila CBS 207.26]